MAAAGDMEGAMGEAAAMATVDMGGVAMADGAMAGAMAMPARIIAAPVFMDPWAMAGRCVAALSINRSGLDMAMPFSPCAVAAAGEPQL